MHNSRLQLHPLGYYVSWSIINASACRSRDVYVCEYGNPMLWAVNISLLCRMIMFYSECLADNNMTVSWLISLYVQYIIWWFSLAQFNKNNNMGSGAGYLCDTTSVTSPRRTQGGRLDPPHGRWWRSLKQTFFFLLSLLLFCGVKSFSRLFWAYSVTTGLGD